jgi:hypothetical protein
MPNCPGAAHVYKSEEEEQSLGSTAGLIVDPKERGSKSGKAPFFSTLVP